MLIIKILSKKYTHSYQKSTVLAFYGCVIVKKFSAAIKHKN